MAKKRKPLTNAAGDVRELTTADFKRMRPAAEALPSQLLEKLRKGLHTIRHVSDAEYEADLRARRTKKPPTV